MVLPDTLREISGLTSLDVNSCACVQDENGILFIYDVVKNEIRAQQVFGGDGDYEGIAKVGESVYVMRSDATLFEISNYTSDKLKVTTYKTNVPAQDCEGLCYDREHQRLLIAVKGKAGKDKEAKDKKATILKFIYRH